MVKFTCMHQDHMYINNDRMMCRPILVVTDRLTLRPWTLSHQLQSNNTNDLSNNALECLRRIKLLPHFGEPRQALKVQCTTSENLPSWTNLLGKLTSWSRFLTDCVKISRVFLVQWGRTGNYNRGVDQGIVVGRQSKLRTSLISVVANMAYLLKRRSWWE